MADDKPLTSVCRPAMDGSVPEFERVLQYLSEDTKGVKERVQGYVAFQELVKLREDDVLYQKIYADMRFFCSCIQRDIVSSEDEISSVALRVLGFLLHRKSFVAKLPDDEACKFLLTLLALITTTSRKAICCLGLWCLALQDMKTSLLALHLKMIVAVLLHGIDNPLGSMAITYEAFQAVIQLARQLPDEMRNLSWTWAPPVYHKLLHSNGKIVELAESCLSGTKSVLLPPLPRLSEVVAVDIQHRLLSKMEEMIKLEGRSPCIAIQAWGWLVKLLGVKSSEEKSLINVMLKVLETSFVNPSTQVRSASQVAWVSVIDVFVPFPGETGAKGSPGGVADPSTGVPSTLKRLKLLLTPLLNTMSWDKDKMVQRSCCCTWIYLLCKLGQSVNEKPIFDAAVLPMLEIVFQLDDKRIDGSVWQACVDLLTDAISCKSLHETNSDPETLHSKRANLSPKTPAGITYTGEFSELHHKNISWRPWHLDCLNSFIYTIQVFLKCVLHQLYSAKSEDGHLPALNNNFEAAQEWWRLLVKGVEVEGRNTVRPSSDHVTAVHLLLKSLSDTCAELKSVNLLPTAWALMEILIDGLGHNIIASSFYRIRLQFAEQMAFMPETYTDGGEYAEASLQDTVTPVVYISAAWFKLVFETPSVEQHENIWMQPVKKLITNGRAGFDIMGNYLGFVWILDHLARESYLHREDSPDIKKAFMGNSKCELLTSKNWRFLIGVWRTVAEKLRELVERSNDVPPVGGCQRDSGYQVVSDVLLFPIKCFLLLSPGGDRSSIGESCGDSPQSNEHTQHASFEDELLSTEGGWFKLFDSVLRISSLKSPQPNSFIGGFFHRIIKVMRSSLQEQGQLPPGGIEKLKLNSSKLSDPCLRFLGDIVAHAMKHAEISSLAMLAISRKRRKTGFGVSSVRVQCIAGMELEDANNLKDLLTVAGRLLTLSYAKYKDEKIHSSIHESVVRVLGALTSIMQHITSQNDSVLLLQALVQPLSYWFTVDSEAPGGIGQAKLLPGSVLEGLSQAWDGLLFCLQTCRPCLVFDSNLLRVQAPSLAPAFLHHNDAISNRTLAFWEVTYGFKAANLTYPPALVKVFNILKQKVNISLPGWTTRRVAAKETLVHNAPQHFYRPRPSMARHLKEVIGFKSNASEKRGVSREDQSGSGEVEKVKIGPAEQLPALELAHQVDQQTISTDPPLGSGISTKEDTTELRQSVNDANDTSVEQQSEFMPTPEGNAHIDELVNVDCSISELNPEEIFKSNSPYQSVETCADVLPTDVPASGQGRQAGTEDSQAAELQGSSRTAAPTEVLLNYEKTEFTSCGDNKSVQTGEVMMTGNNAANIVNDMGPVALVTPPIASNDIPSVPPKMLVGAERPHGNVGGGVLELPVAADESKQSQPVSNLPRRRKKLKFQDDSQEVEYVVIPQSQRKRAGPLTDRQREVRLSQRHSGRVVRTYTRVDFSQSSEGFADDLMESLAMENASYKENIPPSNLLSFQEVAGEGAASRIEVEEVAQDLAKRDSDRLGGGCVKVIPLDEVDYNQLKKRLGALLQSDLSLTYRQIFDQEQYECLPRIIRTRLCSQFWNLRRKVMLLTTVGNADQPASKRGGEHPQRLSEQCLSGGGTNPEESGHMAAEGKEEHIPPSCLLTRKPEVHGHSKRSAKMPTVNLRSSGKLRGGKHWRINSELRKVITARLGIKKIVVKRQQRRSNPQSKVERPPSSGLGKNPADANMADCSTKSWGRQMQACTKQSLERMHLRSDRARVNSSSQIRESSLFELNVCKEINTEVQAPQPTINLELPFKLKENSPFQVRNLNRGLLANTFSIAARIAGDSAAQDCTRANSHNPRKCRAPKRMPSQENSLGTNPSQFRIGERSVSDGEDATTSGDARNETMGPRKSDSEQFALSSFMNREDLGNGCSSMEVNEPPLLVVCLSPVQPMSKSGEDKDGSIRAYLDNSQLAPSWNTRVSCEGSTNVEVPNCHKDFKRPGIVSVGLQSDAEKRMDPHRFGADGLLSQSRTDVNAHPLPSKACKSTEDSGKEPISNVKALLEKEGVRVSHVLAALLASSKWKEMEMPEVIEVDKLLCQLKEAIAGQSSKGAGGLTQRYTRH